ncbi:MAG TPA: substrate-binding domain-containing protein [Gaiellales bacterium]|nr:substrate-binding domain-containing protein [Gaiellales bacterium]
MKSWVRRAPILLALVAAVAALTASTSFGATAGNGVVVQGSGSDTSYFLMTALGNLYNQAPGCNVLAPANVTQPLNYNCPNAASENSKDFVNYYHDLTAERFPYGSSNGIAQICQKSTPAVQFARSSRLPKSSDCTGLTFIGFATDGVTWECFPTDGNGHAQPCNGVTSLTQQALKDIFVNCTVTDWSDPEVGGSSGPITVYVPQAGSGTGSTWASYLGVTLASGQALDTCIPTAAKAHPGQPGSHVSPENTNSLIIANGDQASAIFPFSVGVYHFTYGTNAFSDPNGDGSAVNGINGVQPTNANLLNSTFPNIRNLFNVYCNGGTGSTCTKVNSATLRFIGQAGGFLCKNEGKFNDSLGNPILDPITGLPYRGAPNGSTPTGEIPSTISKFGFVPLPKQGTGTTATYCTSTTH